MSKAVRRFKPNKRFKKDYDKIFRQNPEAANLYLLLCELADKKGRVIADEGQLARLMSERFSDPKEYALKGGPPHDQ